MKELNHNEKTFTQIQDLKKQVNRLSEYIIQAMAGESVPNLAERKQEFIALHNELRALEGKEPRKVRNVVQ